jgi:hypothetical protein
LGNSIPGPRQLLPSALKTQCKRYKNGLLKAISESPQHIGRESGAPCGCLRQGDSEMGFRFDRDTILVSLLTGKPIRKSMQLDSIRADFCGLEFRIFFLFLLA